MASINENAKQGTSSESDRLNKKILDEAKTRFKVAEDFYSPLWTKAKEDLEFSAGEQWPEKIKNDRAIDGRPCLVINKINQSVNQVTNEQRQNRPSINVHPVDDKADVETAKVLSGLIKHIEYNSNADFAYDTAFDSTVRCGLGFFRVVTDYCDPTSFEQDIFIRRVKDRFSALIDPHHVEPDGSDANWGFIFDVISKDEFKALYGDSKLANASTAEWGIYKDQCDWISDDSVRVTEYFYKEFKSQEVYLLSDGSSVVASEFEEIQQNNPEVTVVKKRTAQIPVVKWVKTNGVEILEQTEWPGKYIPIIPVYGAELVIDGKPIYKGMVRDAIDPARMYNYMASAEAEAIGLAPRAPFIAAEGQLEGYNAEWNAANRKNHSVLTYKPTTIAGQPVPPPQRNAFEPAVQAITNARMQASDDLKATTGIYDAALGARSNETSGIAIARRTNQAQTSNFHLVDNLTRAIKHCGRIIVDLIPHIYDTPRIGRMIGEDGTHEIIPLNQEFEKDGETKNYNLDIGRYDVTVDAGPSFQTKRQEAVASMLEVARAYPQIMQFAGDLFIKNQDWPGANELAERIKKTIPPNLIDDKAAQNQVPPKAQAQMQQQGQMIEQLTQKLNELQQEKEMKLIELESRERIEMAKLENQATIELAKLESKEAVEMLAHQIAELDQRTKTLGFYQPIENEHEENEKEFQGYSPEGPGEDVGHFEGNENTTGGASPGQPMEGIEP